jgi:hypothetical protein
MIRVVTARDVVMAGLSFLADKGRFKGDYRGYFLNFFDLRKSPINLPLSARTKKHDFVNFAR